MLWCFCLSFGRHKSTRIFRSYHALYDENMSPSRSHMLSPFFGINEEIMSRGPQDVDMESRETTLPTVSTCIYGDPSHHHRGQDFRIASTTPAGFQEALGLAPWGTSHYYGECHFNIWGIWVCCILDGFRFHDICLDIMPFAPLHLGGWHCALVSGLPRKWVCY